MPIRGCKQVVAKNEHFHKLFPSGFPEDVVNLCLNIPKRHEDRNSLK